MRLTQHTRSDDTFEDVEILFEVFAPPLWIDETGIIRIVGQPIEYRPYVWMENQPEGEAVTSKEN